MTNEKYNGKPNRFNNDFENEAFNDALYKSLVYGLHSEGYHKDKNVARIFSVLFDRSLTRFLYEKHEPNPKLREIINRAAATASVSTATDIPPCPFLDEPKDVVPDLQEWYYVTRHETKEEPLAAKVKDASKTGAVTVASQLIPLSILIFIPISFAFIIGSATGLAPLIPLAISIATLVGSLLVMRKLDPKWFK